MRSSAARPRTRSSTLARRILLGRAVGERLDHHRGVLRPRAFAAARAAAHEPLRIQRGPRLPAHHLEVGGVHVAGPAAQGVAQEADRIDAQPVVVPGVAGHRPADPAREPVALRPALLPVPQRLERGRGVPRGGGHGRHSGRGRRPARHGRLDAADELVGAGGGGAALLRRPAGSARARRSRAPRGSGTSPRPPVHHPASPVPGRRRAARRGAGTASPQGWNRTRDAWSEVSSAARSSSRKRTRRAT
jgi:hypothetical protein